MQMSFEEWMKEIDKIIHDVCGLGHGDIGDQCYYDWYKDKVTPLQAAKRALKNEGFPMKEFPKLVDKMSSRPALRMTIGDTLKAKGQI